MNDILLQSVKIMKQISIGCIVQMNGLRENWKDRYFEVEDIVYCKWMDADNMKRMGITEKDGCYHCIGKIKFKNINPDCLFHRDRYCIERVLDDFLSIDDMEV